MPGDTVETSQLETKLISVITTYLQAQAAGLAPDRSVLLDEHPDLAFELMEFFDTEDQVVNAAAPLRAAARGLIPATMAGADALISQSRVRPPDPSVVRELQILGFEVLEEIARGGAGLVYKARQLQPDRLVAIKTIGVDRHVSAQDLRRFRNEAQALATLRHKNIVTLHQVAEHAGRLFLCMEYMDGGSLADRLTLFQEDPRTAVRMLIPITRAVQHAHQHAILHRDLKPSNILLDSAGEPHVTDFGLARRLDADSDLTRATAILGTPGYMAPEQTAECGRDVTTATDVYGLGGTLYALLTGQAPFRGETPLATARLVLDKDPDSPLLFNPRVDRDLEVICLKCLRKDPSDRYQSAEELRSELERWLVGRPIQARPLSSLERLRRWCRRNHLAAALLAAVFLLVLAATIGQSFTIALLLGEKNKTEKQARAIEIALEQAEEQRGLAQEREALMHQQVYAFRINQAWRYWQSGRAVQARELLALEIPSNGREDLRGFEWHYLWRLCDGQRESLLTLRGHSDDVYCVAYSPDGKQLASCGKDRTIRLWDTTTGESRGVLQGHSAEVDEVLFSPDGQTLASCGDDGTVRLWDVATGRQRLEIGKFSCATTSMAFTPDGKKLYASDQKGRVYEWHLPSGSPGESFAAFDDGVNQIDISPDGSVLAASGRCGGGVFDLLTKKLRFQPARAEGSTGVAFAHRNSVFATILGESVELYDYTQREPVPRKLEGHAKRVEQVAFSPDDRLIATAARDGAVRIWNGRTCTVERLYSGHSGVIWSCAFSPNGRTLATAGSDRTVRIWDCSARTERTVIPARDRITANPTITRDSAHLIGAEGNNIRLWNIGTAMPDRSIAIFEEVVRLALSGDGLWLATEAVEEGNRRRISLYELPEGKKVSSWAFTSGQIHQLQLNADGSQLVVNHTRKSGHEAWGSPGTVAFWNARTGELSHTISTTAGPYALALGGEQIALIGMTPGAPSRDIVLIELASGKARTLAHCDQHVSALEFSPKRVHLAASLEDGTILLYDVNAGTMHARLVGHLHDAPMLSFSPDGKTLASTGKDASIKLWHVATGQLLMTLADLPSGSAAIGFSPDGRILAGCVPTGAGGAFQYVLWHGAGPGVGTNDIVGSDSGQ